MGQCCACSLVEGLTDGEVQVTETSPKRGDKKHKSKGKHASRTPSSSRDRESRSKTMLSPISENVTQEGADPQAVEDADEAMIYRQLPVASKPGPAEKGSGAGAEGGEETPASLASTTVTTPSAGDSPSNSTATPTADDWATWTAADACSPALQVEDDWADWEQAPPALAASEPKKEEAPVATPSTQAAPTPENSGAASHAEPAQVSWPMVPATRELSAAAPKKPGVFPRFASIEAWISGLPELEVVEPPKEKPTVAVSSSVPRATWNMRPSVGTWLTVRRTCRAPASEPATSCRVAFGFALLGSPKVHRAGLNAEALAQAAAPESPGALPAGDGLGLTAEALARAVAPESLGGLCEKPSELVTSEVQAADDALSSFSDAESFLGMEAPGGASCYQATVLNAPAVVEEPLLPSDLFAGAAAEAAMAPALEKPAACEKPALFSDLFATAGAKAAEAVQTVEAVTPVVPAKVAAEQGPAEPRRSWRLLPSVGTWLAPRRFQAEVVPEASVLSAVCTPDVACLPVAAEGGTFLDDQSNEIFRAAASVLPKTKPPAPILPGAWKLSDAKASVLSFDPYAPEDDEPSTTDTEGGEKAEECPIS